MGFMKRPTRTASATSSGPEPHSLEGLRQSRPESESPDDEIVGCENETLARTAALIATGEEPFPTGAPSNVQNYLAPAVRELRRKELLGFVARQLAYLIHGGIEPKTRNNES